MLEPDRDDDLAMDEADRLAWRERKIAALEADAERLREEVRKTAEVGLEVARDLLAQVERLAGISEFRRIKLGHFRAQIEQLREDLEREQASYRRAMNLTPPGQLRPDQQQCSRCGAVDHMNFHVPTHVWKAVAGPEFCNDLIDSVLCLACFDQLADAKGIDYAHCISEVLFHGLRYSVCISDHEALRAENARLREALQHLADTYRGGVRVIAMAVLTPSLPPSEPDPT